MDTVIKNIKQYSYKLDKEILNELLIIGSRYKNVKNYIYSRYSGINSILLIENDRKVRDEYVKIKFYEQWKLPARYWKLALSEAFSNIKSGWSNIKLRIKDQVKENNNLNNEDRHYINYILKSNKLYHKVLIYENFDIPKVFNNKNLNYKYLNNLIRRYTRKYKGEIAYSNKNTTFSVDTGLYSYKNGCINITSTKKGKRLPIKLTESSSKNKTLKVKIIGDKLEIHCPLRIKTKHHKDYTNTIGIDKGYKYLFAVSSEKFYGEKLNTYLNKETERLNKVNSNRNRFYAMYNKYLKLNNTKKAHNILKNNLGKVKYNHNKLKYNEHLKSYINQSLNNLIQEEKPKEIVMENLDFVSWNDTYPKSVKRKLSRWIKGYIRERIEYKCDYNNILYTYINPAYTSKICSICGGFGKRNGDVFSCETCKNLHSDLNASKNILKRKYDKEINLYTKYSKVKEILEKRVDKSN